MEAAPDPIRDSNAITLSEPATVFAWTATRFAGTPAALFAVDAALADVLRTTSQPLVGQMRLTWWHDALTHMGERVPAHPILQALANGGVAPDRMAQVVEGWEALLEVPLDAAAIALHALRGEALFAVLATRAGPAVRAAGAGWALADLAAHLRAPALAAIARTQARAALDVALRERWAHDRAIGALALDASLALAGEGVAGSPRRARRILRFRLFGR